MRQIDLDSLPVLWDDEQLPHLASDVNTRVDDRPTTSSLGHTADPPRGAVPTSPIGEGALAWMASRLRWELRLEELHKMRPAEARGSATADEPV